MALVSLPPLYRDPPAMREFWRVSACESVKCTSGPRVGFSHRNKLYRCNCGTRSDLRSDNAERGVPSTCLRDGSLSRGVPFSDWGLVSSRSVAKLGSSRAIKISRETILNKKEEDDEDDTDVCPVECVREFTTRTEFDDILQEAKEQNSLVVVDFFRTACGSCRYIEKGFVKLCKGAGNKDVSVIFLKHNVMDEYEEQSEVAESFKIRVVPLFHFYKDGKLVDSFPTREKNKILEAICKHTGMELEDLHITSGL